MTTEKDEATERKLKQLGISAYNEISFMNFMEYISELFSYRGHFAIELFNEALAKSAVTAVGSSEAVQSGVSGRAVPMQDVEFLLSEWSKIYSPKIIELAKAFDDSLKKALGAVKAGIVQKGWWTYLATDESNVKSAVKGKRFLELHAAKSALKPQFGNYVSREQAREILRKMQTTFEEVEGRESGSSKPPFWFKNIETLQQAEYAAQLIAELYSEIK